MTQEEINEGNRLIAKFIFPTIEKEAEEDDFVIERLMFAKMAFFLKDYARLEFHTKWNWLMPVVEKIESLGYFCMINKWTSVYTGSDGERLQVTSVEGNSKILNTWKAIIEFIKWINQQPNIDVDDDDYNLR